MASAALLMAAQNLALQLANVPTAVNNMSVGLGPDWRIKYAYWQVFIEGGYYQLGDKSPATRCRANFNSHLAPSGSA
jgi:hypothetical protein